MHWVKVGNHIFLDRHQFWKDAMCEGLLLDQTCPLVGFKIKNELVYL